MTSKNEIEKLNKERKTVSFGIEIGLLNKVRQVREDTGVPLTHLINKAIREYLENHYDSY